MQTKAVALRCPQKPSHHCTPPMPLPIAKTPHATSASAAPNSNKIDARHLCRKNRLIAPVPHPSMPTTRARPLQFSCCHHHLLATRILPRVAPTNRPTSPDCPCPTAINANDEGQISCRNHLLATRLSPRVAPTNRPTPPHPHRHAAIDVNDESRPLNLS